MLLLNKLQKGKEYFILCAIIYDKMFLKDAISPRDKEAANVKVQQLHSAEVQEIG